MKELKDDVIGDIYSFSKIELPEEPKTWNNTYSAAVDSMIASGQTLGHYVATATSSDQESKGFQLVVLVKYDLTVAESLHDLRGEGGCACNIF